LRSLFKISIIISALLLSGAAHSDTPAKIETFTLSNGLEVIVIPNHRVPAVSHMIWYKIGAADDPQGKSGLAHFHEHLMFQGTAKYKAGEYSDIIARHGGQQNAFTGYDATSYFVNISKEYLPLAMELEADRMRGLIPLDSNVAKEKLVIIEERRSRIENNPGAQLAEQMNAALFRHHPYHLPVIGWMHEMETLTKNDALEFHKRYYHPNNAILIVSGDVTAAELKPLAQKYYGNLAKAEIPARKWNAEPPHIAERRVTLRHPNVSRPSWNRSYASSSIVYGNKDDTLPLFVLSQVLGGGKTSRLYQALVVEQKIASGVSANYSGFNIGPALFEISITPQKDVSLEAIEKAVEIEIEKISKEPITDSELSRAKTLLKAEAIYARDGLTSMARIMGWVRVAGLDSDYFSLWPELIERVTPEQVLTAAKNTLVSKQSVTGILLPEERQKQ